jgi:hypothetical protein
MLELLNSDTEISVGEGSGSGLSETTTLVGSQILARKDLKEMKGLDDVGYTA